MKEIIKALKLILNNPANNLNTTSKDLLETTIMNIELRGAPFEIIKEYSALGYDVSLTNIFGKDAVKMVKRYSYVRKDSILCEQIIDHDNLTEERLQHVCDFMYRDIQNQEATGKYYTSLKD